MCISKLPFCESACSHSPQTWFLNLMILCTASLCWFNSPFWEATYPLSTDVILYVLVHCCNMMISGTFSEAAKPHSSQTRLLIFKCSYLMCNSKLLFCESAYPYSPQTWFLILMSLCTASTCWFNLPFREAAYPLSTDKTPYVLVHCSNMMI